MKKNIIYIGATIVILVIVIFTWLYVKQSSKSPMKKSIVVLPFSIDSNDKQDEYLVDGLLNGIISNLAKSLGVYYVVEGTVKTLNDSIEMQVRLLDETGDQICSETYIGSKNELLEITNKIQLDITETINHNSSLRNNN